MTNLLKMAHLQALEALRTQKSSVRRIAPELHVAGVTVAKYVREL